MKLGSSERKTASKIKSAAPKNEWFRNVIKSAGYATADIVKETIPSAFEFVESNGKDAVQLYNDLRQEGPKSVTKLLAQSVEKNAYLKMANDALANTKEDLKTGKFYNKEREERSVLGDEDFSFGDDDFDFNFDGDDLSDGLGSDNGGSSELSHDKPVTNVKKVTVNNINANITKNNPMVQSINKQNEVILSGIEATNKVNTALATTGYTLTSKVASDVMVGLSSVNDNLSALVNFNNDSMSKYVAASIQYYSDSLAVLNTTLEHLKRPTTQTQDAKEEIDPFLANGGLNVKEYAKLVKKNVGDVVQGDLFLNSLYSFASDTDSIKMLAASPLKAIPKMMSKVIIPTIVRESAAEFDKTFANFFPALLNKFNKLANDDNWFLSKVGQLFGYNPRKKTSIDVSMYNKEDMNFNGITQKAITEVIPTYLRKILSAISGNNEMLFDYESGKFTDYMKAIEERDNTVRNKSLSAMETYSDLKGRLGAIRFTDEQEKTNFFKDFEDFMFKLSKSNGINPYVREVKGERVDDLKELYSGPFAEIFRGALLSLDKSDLMKLMGSDIFSAKASVTRHYENAQQKVGSSILPVLEAWDSTGDYEKSKDGSFKRKDSLKMIQSDKYGKSTLDYLREMRNLLVEGIIVFPSTDVQGIVNQSSPTGPQNDNDVFKKRRERLKNISQEDDKLVLRDQSDRMREVKQYTDEEKARLKAKGIIVADSVSDITSDASTTQLTDIFKTYSQLSNSESTAANQKSKAGSWLTKIFSKGSKKVNSVRDVFDNIFSMPGRVISNVFNELDNGLYKVIFGVSPDGNDESFVSKIVTSIKTEFGTFFDWTKDKFLTPLYDAFLGEEGVITKLKNSEAMESLKKMGSKMADWAFGNLDDNGHRRNGAFSDVFNDIKDVGRSVSQVFTGKEYIDRHGVVHAAQENSVFGNTNAVLGDIYKNAKLYLLGNKKDKMQNTPMFMPTAFGDTMPGGQGDSSVSDQIQSLYSPEAANELAQRPSVMVNPAPNKVDTTGIDSPFLANYLNNIGNNKNDNTIGNGGFNILDWLKEKVSLQYSVDVNDQKGETKTVKFGEDVDETVGSGGHAPMMVNGFPYYSQRDPRYAHRPYNLSTGKGGGQSLAFGDRGCGPTAMSMVANGLGQNVDPLDMANLATEEGYSVAGGTKGSFFKSIGEKLGLSAKEKQTTESKVESALMQGKPIIFRGRKTTDSMTPFTPDGHFVVGVGGKNGKIRINDPNGVETSGEYDVKDIVNESNKMWTFDDTGKGTDLGGVSRPKYNVVNVKTKKEKFVTEWSRDVSPDGTGEIRGVIGELAQGFRAAGHDIISLAMGDPNSPDDEDTKAKKFGRKFKEALPKALTGGILGGGLGAIVSATGGLGLVGSMFLPGGPVGAAILGTAVGFAAQSEKLKNWLFGKRDPEDETKRLGGFISAKTQEFVKDHKVTILGGAAVGGLKSMLMGSGMISQMLFGGPLTGALIGAGVGLAVRSEKFQNMVFGKDDDSTGKKIGGMLSKSYNAIAENKKKIGGAGIGLLGGAAAGAVISNMGILGSAFFLGPVGGAIAGAGLGIAAASEKWRDRVFGKYNEDNDRREGGLMQEFKSGLVHNVLTPLKDSAKEAAVDMKYWFQEKVMLPVADLFGPFKTAVSMIAEDVMYKLSDIAEGVKFTFNKFIGEPVGNFLKEKIFDKLAVLGDKMATGFRNVVKFVAGSPFKLMDLTLNQLGASIVQSKTRKRRDKYESAMQQLFELEDRKVRNELTAKEEKKYNKLRKVEARYYNDAHDQDKLNAKDNFKEIRAKKVTAIDGERKIKLSELAKEKELHRKQRRFNAIFGPDQEFDEEALAEYDKLYKRDNGKKIKGFKNKAMIRKEAATFIQRYKDGKVKDTSKEVSEIRDNIKDNLTPIRKTLYSIQDDVHHLLNSIRAKVEGPATEFMVKNQDLVAQLPWNKKKQQKADASVQMAMDGIRAEEAREEYLKRTAKQEDLKKKYKSAFRTANVSEERKAELKAKYRKDEGSGGQSKDASWLMVGKGKDTKKEADEPKKEKSKGFLASLGSSMFGALKKFDSVNDKEEAEKEKKKESKSQLAEKQKAVSGKNYEAISKELAAKNKEAEEKNWKQSLLNAVTSIKAKSEEHRIDWSAIFSKKGLITGAILAALPALYNFLKNPGEAIKNLVSSLINSIKISIGWLFGNKKERTDADGNTILNSGLADSTARLTRNATVKAVKSETFQKGARLGSKIVKGAKKYIDKAKNLFTMSDAAYELYEKGVRNVDDLIKEGVPNLDALTKRGISSADDLVALGVKNVDDLGKLGIKSVDDLAKLGVDLSTKKGQSALKKFGLKYTQELGAGSPLLVDAVPKSVKTTLLEKASDVATNVSKPIKEVAEKTGAKLAQTATDAAGTAVKIAEPAVSTVLEKADNLMNTKFVKSITDWLTAAFTNQKVVKKLGADVAQNTLKELLDKVSKGFTEKVLKRFGPKISAAMMEVAGRAGGALASMGALTLAFGVADFLSGAVNAERLFEIPPGTATLGMKTMSAVLQTILGIGMIGPLIDVANEIMAEVFGTGFLTMIATVGYSYLTQAVGGDVKLQNLQAEFDKDYEMYKAANGLKDLSKRGYQDIVNPSFGTKIVNGVTNAWDKTKEFGSNMVNGVTEFGSKAWNKTKEITSKAWEGTKEFGSNAWNATKEFGSKAWNKTKDVGSKVLDKAKETGINFFNRQTGDVFNDSAIRAELGLNEDTKIRIRDRLAMGASNALEVLSFGKLDSSETIHNILGIQNEIIGKASELWTGLKESASKKVEEAKKAWNETWTGVGKKITGSLGLVDENGEPLPFTEGVSVVKDKATEFVKGKVTEFQEGAKEWWNERKTETKLWMDTGKLLFDKAKTAVGKKITGTLGLVDDNGEPLLFSEGVSLVKDKAIDSVKGAVNDFQEGSKKWWEERKTSASEWWNQSKTKWDKAWTGVGKTITGTLGLVDENGEPVAFGEGVDIVKNKAVTSIKSILTDIAGDASKFWTETKDSFKKGWESIKQALPNAFKGLDNLFGKLFNMTDDNGNTVSLTDGVKTAWTNTSNKVSSWWNNMGQAGKQDIENRNNSGQGGFGGEPIPTNIGARGCGPTAMAMVASKLTGNAVDPVAMSNMATSAGYANEYGTNGKYFTYAATKLGINASEGRTTAENLTSALNSGQPVILRGQSDGKHGSAFTRAGHYVVAVGQKDGKVIINDPRGVQYSGAYDMNDIVSQSNVMWSFGQQKGPYGVNVSPIVLGGAANDAIPGELIYKYAAMHVGKPYVWGANGPSSFDCSGLVNYAAKQAGVKLPASRPTAATWRKHCTTITRDQLRVGDLGFYRENGSITHVAIYAGDGQWCHAEGGSGPKGQGGKVKVNSPTYLNEFGRIPGVSATGTQYIGNTSGLTDTFSGTTSTGSTGDILTDLSGFLSTVGKNAMKSAMTGEAMTTLTFSDYLSSNGSTSSNSTVSADGTYTGETISLGSRKTDAATLNKYLGGRLANKGATIISLGNKHGVDPALAASILHHESANGTSNAIVNYNNPGGIMDWDNNWKTLRRFNTLDTGIEYTISNLSKKYISQGLNTIPAIGNKYAPIGAANDPGNLNTNWVPNVTKLYKQYSFDGYSGAGDSQYSGAGEESLSAYEYGGFGEVETLGTEIIPRVANPTLMRGTSNVQPSANYTISDKTSVLGMGDNYVKTRVQEHISATGNNGPDMSGILEKVLDILSRIADNTGVTSKNIKDAITTVMTNSTAVTTVNNVNGNTTTAKKTVNTNSQYTESEARNRTIAQRIAQGRFV